VARGLGLPMKVVGRKFVQSTDPSPLSYKKM
jgi:hypothetical protein